MNNKWRATKEPIKGRLADLMRGQWDINKMAHYLEVYERAFDLGRPIKSILEIGASFGGSLELWRKYFYQTTKVVGIDYNPNCAQFDNPENNVFVRIGKQQDIEFLQSVIEEFGPFDIIIDDGSHIPEFTFASFIKLFIDGLTNNGVYLVEDLHTCYSSDCKEPFDNSEANTGCPQFTEMIKFLIDVMHRHYLGLSGDEFSNAFEPGNPGYCTELDVPLLTQQIKRIEINDSIAVIRKGQRELPRMIRRWSRERMTSVLNPDAALFLDENPHLGFSDVTRQDWLNG